MKRVIILERKPPYVRVAFWAVVPAERQQFYASAQPLTSDWRGASQAENDALTSGAVVERVLTIELPATQGALRAALLTQAEAFQSEIDARNEWDRYGTFYDDVSGWTVSGVARG